MSDKDREREALKAQLSEVLPKTGLVYSERGAMTEILCKPKIMPIKSDALKKFERMEKEMMETNDEEGKDGEGEEATNPTNSEVKEEEIYNSEKDMSSEGEKKGMN